MNNTKSVVTISRKKPSKYKNVKNEIDGIKFDSKGEAARYAQLKLLQSAGVISGLKLQVPFVLADKNIVLGKPKRSLIYRADFVYFEEDIQVVEDLKGAITDIFLIKAHLMKSLHNIDIRLTKIK